MSVAKEWHAAMQNKNGRVFYVAQKRGDGGVDWGYTNRRDEALLMSQRLASIFLGENVPGRYIQNDTTRERREYCRLVDSFPARVQS